MHSAINIIGLSAGLTFALVVGVFIWGELQVNQSLSDVDRLYLIESKVDKESDGFPFFSPSSLVKETALQFPTLIESYYRFWDRQVTVSKYDRHFRIQSMIGDSTFVPFFGFKVLFGDGSAGLLQANSIVITSQTALQFFDRADVVGETLSLSTERSGLKEFVITAVLVDPEPKNSVSDFMNMNAQIFIPLQNSADFTLPDPDTWTDIISYIKLTSGTSTEQGEQTLNTFLKANAPESISGKLTVSLNPLQDYYLLTNHSAVKKLIISLSVIVFFILILAVANFVNISIATSFSRLKEIGVRKVVGGLKMSLVLQFLTEAVLLSFLAGTISLVAYELLNSFFSNLLNAQLPSLLDFKFTFWLIISTGFFVIGLLAGLYPALYLSTITITASLKGKFKSVRGTFMVSRGLIALQFIVAIFVLISTGVLSRQVSYFLDKDLGFDKSFVLVVTSVPRLWNDEGFSKMTAVKEEFQRLSIVEDVSLSWGAPGNFSPVVGKVFLPGKSVDEGVQTSLSSADASYAGVYGLTVSSGIFLYDKAGPRIPNRVVVNETLQKILSLKVGDIVKMGLYGSIEFTVAGIVGDFNFESLHEKVKPVIFVDNEQFRAYRNFSFRLSSGSLAASVEEIEQQWKGIFPNEPFSYTFLDERLKDLYKSEMQLRKASSVAAILVILIVLSGVLGLVSLSAAKRGKEIGIRKVHGASVFDILTLISKEYAILLAMAFLAGTPAAWYFARQWLDSFAYRIDLSWWMFGLPVIGVVLLTILVVVAQSYKAAISNPVRVIKNE